jgi:hypothetical protein
MKKVFVTIVFLFSCSLIFAQTGPGHQPTNIKNHPRVNQVNSRIDNQEHRIKEEVKEGDISKQEAREDKRNLKQINREKRLMRKQDNGHLTTSDQQVLNQQLNQNSKEIGK